MPIQSIPLSQLDLSPLNVRKTRTKEHIAKMAASIEAQGILQNLMVHEAEGGKFAVAIGGTRLEALRLGETEEDRGRLRRSVRSAGSQ
jgi:ParB family chromosome partitioning protein